jgi:hypothetical protein
MKNNIFNETYGYSDADWAGSFNQRSTTIFCTFIGRNFITWKNKKQNVICRSRISSHDINGERVDMDQAIPYGS